MNDNLEPGSTGPSANAHLALGIATVLLIVAVGIGLYLAVRGPSRPPNAFTSPIRIVPPERLPGAPEEMAQADPALLLPQTPPEVARRINASIPYVADKGPSARPFHFSGSAEDRARARTCLAAAALYEAGGADEEGQKAVMQVVLNRVRHPAYVPSICGVVFQGQERSTGCQFTFTCDGSLRYQFAPERWTKALARADAALDGAVFKPVGLATHYHTDWVHPYWSKSLDKLTKIGTHLFFRWQGYWGTRPAFAIRPGGIEQRIVRLASFEAHRDPSVPAGVPAGSLLALPPGAGEGTGAVPPPRIPVDPAPYGVPAALIGGTQILLVHPEGGAFLLAVPASMTKDRFAKLANALCGMEGFCRVQGWRDASLVPRGYPFGPAAREALAFEYFRDLKNGTEYVFGT